MFKEYLEKFKTALEKYNKAKDLKNVNKYWLPSGVITEEPMVKWERKYITVKLEDHCKLVLDDCCMVSLYRNDWWTFQLYDFNPYQSEILVYLYSLDKKFDLVKYFNS